jgi:hypothetical protein
MFRFSPEPIDIQIQNYIVELKEFYGKIDNKKYVSDQYLLLPHNYVFMPEHKKMRYLDYMAYLDERTALGGSEGEPELFSVIRSDSLVEILDIIYRDDEQIVRFYQQSEEEIEYVDYLKMYSKATQFKFDTPRKLRFLKIRVTDYVKKRYTRIYDPLGMCMKIKGRKAEAPDYTDGFIEDNGIVGYIYVDHSMDDFSLSPCDD